MEEIYYYCDNCKKQIEENEEVFIVEINVTCKKQESPLINKGTEKKEYCSECIKLISCIIEKLFS
jgi:hypothetical protein